MQAKRVLALLGVLVLGVGCGSSGKGSSATTSTSPRTSSSRPGTSTAPTATSALTIYLVAKEHLAPAGRLVPGTGTPEAAVRALLRGPTGAIEAGLGMTTAIPAGTSLHSVTVANGVATVDLSSEFASGGGSLSMQERVAQVVFTLTQFPHVERVRFRIDGSPVSTIGGEGLMVDGVDRATFVNVTPKILVESPTPGEVVRSPLHLSGMANTFEATVNYAITDSGGTVLAKGFTTATAGSGTWGTFAATVPFAVKKSGLGRLAVYEVSAKDGSRVNEISVPIQLP
jgi:germination protein M